MTDPALRSRTIFIWSFFFVLCALALLFIFFYVSYLCGQLLLVGSGGTGTCMVPIGTFWFAGGFLLAALVSLYRVRTLMNGG